MSLSPVLSLFTKQFKKLLIRLDLVGNIDSVFEKRIIGHRCRRILSALLIFKLYSLEGSSFFGRDLFNHRHILGGKRTLMAVIDNNAFVFDPDFSGTVFERWFLGVFLKWQIPQLYAVICFISCFKAFMAQKLRISEKTSFLCRRQDT